LTLIILKSIWLALIVIGLLYWVGNIFLARLLMRGVRVLENLSPTEPAVWPKVSVIATACDEEKDVEAAVLSRLHDNYPNLELILVNDRSTDKTGEIIERLARSDSRVTTVHITELPKGWLGKVWAMQKGVELATGDWLLFSDGDLQISNGALKKAVALCEQDKIDLLSVLPVLLPVGIIVDAVLAALIRVLCFSVRVWAVPNPKSKAFLGIGAFDLVRRAAFERTPGFEWLKMEVSDDAAMGLMMKQSGARTETLNGRGQMSLRWFTSVSQIESAGERAFYTAASDYSIGRVIFIAVALFFLELAPFLALIPIGFTGPVVAGSHMTVMQMIGVVMVAVALAVTVTVDKWMGRHTFPALFYFAGTIPGLYMMVISGCRAWRRGGLMWRGTFYPIDELKKGRRVRLL
jgi:glycosyltransferase involved in cell wall biosynthesis